MRIIKARKKPVVVEAIKYIGENSHKIFRFCGEENASPNTCSDKITIHTLEGRMNASVGDWIIKGVNGEFYPCKSDIFKRTYDIIKESVIDFGFRVLASEGIKDFKIKTVDGNEGLCLKDTKQINIGINAVNNYDYKLMLHEIAHILTDNNHYSTEFLEIEKQLIRKYL